MLKKFLLSPLGLTIGNGLFVSVLIFVNATVQVMCIPTLWALIVLCISFICTIFYPVLFARSKFVFLISFLCGISFCVFIYCILFLEKMNFVGFAMIPFFGIGLLVYIPHYLAVQLFWKNVLRPKSKKMRIYFGLGVALSLSLIPVAGWKYNNGLSSIQASEQSGFTVLERNFMTEKILGMHFIYHTRFCEFDGWRPP